MELPNTSLQVIELNVSLSQQAWHWSRAQKHGAWKHFHSTLHSICHLSIQKRGCQVWQSCPKDSMHLGQTGVWILVSLGKYLRTHLKDHTRYDRGPEIHGKPRRVSLPFSEAQLAGCLSTGRWSVGVGCRHPVTMRKALFKTLSMRRV